MRFIYILKYRMYIWLNSQYIFNLDQFWYTTKFSKIWCISKLKIYIIWVTFYISEINSTLGNPRQLENGLTLEGKSLLGSVELIQLNYVPWLNFPSTMLKTLCQHSFESLFRFVSQIYFFYLPLSTCFVQK